MGCGRETVTVFSPQAEPVLKAIEQDGICFSREAYVQKKYGESAPIFLTAYRWYVKAAQSGRCGIPLLGIYGSPLYRRIRRRIPPDLKGSR